MALTDPPNNPDGVSLSRLRVGVNYFDGQTNYIGWVNPDRLAFGGRIAALRKAAGLTQADLGQALNVTPQAVAHWEKGRSLPAPTELVRLASALRLPSVALLYSEAPRPASSGRRLADETVAEYVTRRLVEGWDELPAAERAFIEDVVQAAERFRARLVQEEGVETRARSAA